MAWFGRFAVNILISVVLLGVFHWFGWITFESLEFGRLIWTIFVMTLVAVGIAVAIGVAAKLAIAADSMILSLAVLVGGVIGIVGMFWFSLIYAAQITGLYTVNVPFFWQGIVMTLMYYLIRIHEPKKEDIF